MRDAHQLTSFFFSLSLHAAVLALAILGVGDGLKVDMDKPMYTVNLVSLNQSEDPAEGEMGEAAGAPPAQQEQEAAAAEQEAAAKPVDLKAEKAKPEPVKDDAKAISEKKADEKKKPEKEPEKKPAEKPEEKKLSKEDLLKEALKDVKKDVAASDKAKPKGDAAPKKDAVASELAELRKGAGGNIYTTGGTGPGGAGGGKGSGAGGTGSGLMSVYGAIVEQAIKKNWRYPVFGSDKNASVVLEIKIDPKGKISASRVLTPSGRPDFDDSAMRAVSETQTLPPPPSRSVDTLHITFNLQDLRK